MQVDIKQTDNGIKIWEHFVYAPQKTVPGIINLQAHIGQEMAYDRGSLLSIDFPGEYDIQGILINVMEGVGNKLNYLISYKDKEETFWIIQSPEILEHGEITDRDFWIFEEESVEKKLDQLEIEGERIKISNLTFEPSQA